MRLIVSLLMVGLILSGCSKSEAKVSFIGSNVLYIDDIDPHVSDAADEFETAFALESTCHGMTLLRYSKIDKGSQSDVEVLEHPHWDLSVFDISHPDPDHPDRNYAVDMTPLYFKGLTVYSGPRTVRDAVRLSCFVAAGKGGQ